MPSIEINTWFQDAVENRLIEHVRSQVQKRDNLEESVFIETHDISHYAGFISVRWSHQVNKRAPTTRKTGLESFTLAEVLRICMTDVKEEK